MALESLMAAWVAALVVLACAWFGKYSGPVWPHPLQSVVISTKPARPIDRMPCLLLLAEPARVLPMITPSSSLDCHIITPPKPATASVIWMHGLGATAHDFDAIIPQLQANPSGEATRWLFPQAPSRPVTLNQGYVMPAWYDILGIDRMAKQDVAGIQASAAAIECLIQAEVAAGIAPERIFLVGFSQGGAMALYTGMCTKTAIGGVVGLSCYLPAAETLQAMPTLNTQTPIYMAHGTMDEVVSLAFGEESATILTSWGAQVVFQTYPMAHSLCSEEVEAVRDWIAACLERQVSVQ
jgi:phospholipase/carboxylesterase